MRCYQEKKQGFYWPLREVIQEISLHVRTGVTAPHRGQPARQRPQPKESMLCVRILCHDFTYVTTTGQTNVREETFLL